MERLKAYTNPAPNGGVNIDTYGLAVDLIMVMKAGFYTKTQFLEMIGDLWDQVHVEVDYSGVTKQ